MKKRITSEEFRVAIIESLCDLIDKNESITHAAVIKNARTKCGNKVGETTLYKKNKNTKAHVHKDLIDKIDDAIGKSKKKRGKTTRGDTIKSLREEKSELILLRKGLTDKVVAQEALINKLQRDDRIEMSRSKSLEGELYVAHSVLLTWLKARGLKDFEKLISVFEVKNQNTDYLDHLKKRIEILNGEIQYSTIFNAKFGENRTLK